MKLEDQPNIIPNFLKGLLIEQYGEQISNNIINGYTCKRKSSFRVNALKSTVKEIKEVKKQRAEIDGKAAASGDLLKPGQKILGIFADIQRDIAR